MQDSRGVILLLEDDVDIRESLHELLDGAGFSVVIARDGREAREYLENPTVAKPRAILLDLMLPVLSGWELLEWMSERRDLDAIKTIVVSAADPRRLQEAVETGRVDHVVQKPFTHDALEKLILETVQG
jgi:CheY-like chemotaxis protein